MPICIPIKELKSTADFAETVRSAGEPVIVTRNGRASFVSLSMEQYDSLLLEAARSRLYRSVDRAEADVAAGRTVGASELARSLRGRVGA